MQQQDLNKAIEYAREMQRRAGNFNDSSAKVSDINNIFRPETENKFSGNVNENQHTNNKFIFNQHQNSKNDDFSLILALILLLSHDGGDRALLLALLYIMT